MAKFFDREGFYIILFLCVCVVAITAVWVSRTGSKNDQNIGGGDTNIVDTTPNKDTSTGDTGDTSLPATGDTNVSTGDETNEPADTTTSTNTSTKTNTATAAKFSNPLKVELTTQSLARDYSKEELVCFNFLGQWRTHEGVDLSEYDGTEVLAAASGKVVEVRNDIDFGWTVVVDHGNGYRTVYANLDEKVAVKKNDSVKNGQKIGVIGSTSILEKNPSQNEENLVPSHLHFEILKKSGKSYESIDPKKYLSIEK